jgi:hypothetical protein
MTKLEKLYNAIQELKEPGVKLPEELIEETNRVEEEIIKNEVIPTLSDAIDPIISQIQRELLLTHSSTEMKKNHIEYISRELGLNLKVKNHNSTNRLRSIFYG